MSFPPPPADAQAQPRATYQSSTQLDAAVARIWAQSFATEAPMRARDGRLFGLAAPYAPHESFSPSAHGRWADAMLLCVDEDMHQLRSGRCPNGNALLHLVAQGPSAPREGEAFSGRLALLIAKLAWQLDLPNAALRAPLHVAAFNASPRVVDALLAAGAAPGLLDSAGQTPLHDAARHGCVDIVEALLLHGADPAARDNEGSTPWDCARKFRHEASLSALLSRQERSEMGMLCPAAQPEPNAKAKRL